MDKKTQADKHPVSGLLISPPVLAATISYVAKSVEEEPLRGHSEKPSTSKAVRQGKGARPAPMTAEQIERLPPEIAKRVKQARGLNGHDKRP